MLRIWTAISRSLPTAFRPQVIIYRILLLLSSETTIDKGNVIDSQETNKEDMNSKKVDVSQSLTEEDVHNKHRPITFAFTAPREKHSDGISGDSDFASDEDENSHCFVETEN